MYNFDIPYHINFLWRYAAIVIYKENTKPIILMNPHIFLINHSFLPSILFTYLFDLGDNESKRYNDGCHT